MRVLSTRRWLFAALIVLTVVGLVRVWPSSNARGLGSVSQEWLAIYSGPVQSGEQARALVVDATGNVIVTGTIGTVKYSPDGEELWAADASGNDIAVDALGNVYVVTPAATTKYDPDGDELWSVAGGGAGLAVSAEGDVYIVGAAPQPNSSVDYVTVRLSTSGEERWTATYDGGVMGDDTPEAIAIDAAGNVIVTGRSAGETSEGYATIAYNDEGTELWIARYDGPAGGDDGAAALAIDGDGSVYVTGSATGLDTASEFATVKYDNAGVEQWAAPYAGPPGGGRDGALAIAVTGDGNVIVTGTSLGPTTSGDVATISYAPDGAQLWIARYDGPIGGWDAPMALAVDGESNAYVTGTSGGSGTGSAGWDYATVAYAPDGTERWVARFDGPSAMRDVGRDIAIGQDGDVIVTGGSLPAGYVTIVYAQSPAKATPTPLPTSTPAPIVGDASCDGVVTSVDAAIVLQLDAGLVVPTACQQGTEVNGDGVLNALDATLILQFVAGLLASLPP